MISLYFLLIMVVTLSLAFLKPYWVSTTFLFGFIIVYRWLNAFAKIGLFAIAMECCLKKVSASQFTFYMTIGAVGSMVGATLIGPVKENFGWVFTLCSFAAMMALAWSIMQFLNINKLVGQIDALEKEDIERKVLVTAEG